MRRPRPREGRKRSPDDAWADRVRAECAKAVGAWLEGSVRLDRPIRSLTFMELEHLAEAATTRWIVLASEKLARSPDEPGSKELAALLLG